MEADEVLKKAWDAVVASGVPEPLQEVAFREAIALIVPNRGSGTPRQKPGGAGHSQDVDAPEDQAVDVDADEVLKKFSKESGVAAAELIEVFYFDPDGTPHINVAARKLGTTTAGRAKAVATAITAAHYFAGDDTQIPIETIRSECDRLKCYDSKNFINHLGSASGVVLSGSGNSRVLRAKSTEIEAALRTVISAARGVKE